MTIRILEVLLPVLVMVLLGIAARRTKLLSRPCIDGMKYLATKVILPVAIFNALATAEYTASILYLVSIMLVMLVVSFWIGFLLKPLLQPAYRKYVPFLVSVYEGGMIGYPLYANLCGSENLSYIAMLDIAGLIFGFSVFMSMLHQADRGEKISTRTLLTDSLRNPAFIAAVLGLIAGITGLGSTVLASPLGTVYSKTVSMVTAPLSTIILLIVGYEIQLNTRLLSPCLRTIVLRFLLQAAMAAGVIFAVHGVIGTNRLLDLAIIMYMASPATFSMQSFVHSEDGSAYVSTTNSLYCIVSILVYAVAAVIVG